MKKCNFEVICYFDSTSYQLFNYIDDTNYSYAYITHDKDIDDKGLLKKAHIHLLLFFDNARTLESLQKEFQIFNISLNQISFVNSKKKAIQYLIHLNNPNKAKYLKEDIIYNNLDINKYFDSEPSENNDLLLIYDFILASNYNCSMKSLFEFCLQNNLWSTYRRNYTIIKDLIIQGRMY